MRKKAERAAANDGDSTKRTLVILLWALITLLWSIFTPPHRTFAARVLLFQPLWAVRMFFHDTTWLQDLALGLFVHSIYSWWTGAWRFWTPNDFHWLDLNDHVLRLYIEVFSLLGACGVLAGGIVHRGHQLKPDELQAKLRHQPIDEGLLPPLLIPSRTTHSRIFPRKHAFSYSYLFVGVPIGLRGQVNCALSVDSEQRSWFNVDSADYLARGNDHLDLAEKLKHYLHTQGITDREYAFAYLVTAPRFLGYSFNPVSFWYLYDSETILKYMILEVNNTFDERRMYLLRTTNIKSDSTVNAPEPEASSPVVFTETWDKDFHVSPFNSRKGFYSLRATDPLAAYQSTGRVQLDNTIDLHSSKESKKIVARIYSEGAPKEVTQITQFQLMRFIAAWWWVGFLTFPRIVWQAQKLYFRKNLHVWYRPEVADTSIGRAYTDDEKHLETCCHAFLEHAVQRVATPLRLVYQPAHMAGHEIVMYSPGFTYEEEHRRSITIRVLSPAFYSRFVHYAHAKEAFDRECLATEEKNRTLSIETPSLLPILLEVMQKPGSQTGGRRRSFIEQLRWDLMRRLRCPPPNAAYHSNDNQDYDVKDIRSFGSSEFDTYVMEHGIDEGTYRRILTKLFIAQRFAGGVPIFVIAADWLLRATILFVTVYACGQTHAGDVLRPTELTIAHIRTAGGLLILANGVHIWSYIKG